MKKIFTLLMAVAVTISLTITSCDINCTQGSGKQVSETRSVGDFTAVEVSGGYKVVLKQDSVSSVKISADDNVMKYIKTEVSGGKLKIHSSKSICSSGEYVININLKTLTYFNGSGAIDLVSDGKMTIKDLQLKFSGASKVDLDINADNVTTHSSGMTDLSLKGQAISNTVEFSGSGKLNALDFVVNKYRIHTSGASDCQINVLNELTVNSSGASDIKYRGNPSKVTNNKSGASSLEKIN